jgi:exopolysaccharide production protein ExoZ
MSKLRKIVHLQALRALSASVVVATHALEYPIRRHILGPETYQLAWAIGWTGVASFFMISGLIMIRSAADGFGSATNAWKFALNRLMRIVPLYWLAVLPFAAATMLRHEPLTAGMVTRTLLFIPYLAPAEHAMRPIVGQGWTLNYEMMFYALFTVCLLFPRRIGLAILLSAFPVAVLARMTVWPLVPYRDPTTALQFWTDPVTLFFVIGMLVGLAEVRAQGWHRVRHPMAWTMLAFALLVTAFLLGGGSFPMPIAWQACYALCGALSVILCTSASDHAFPRLGRIAESAGDASYSTYLVHPLLLMVMAAGWDRLPTHLQSPPAFVLLALLVCNAVGYGCYRMIERPLSRWLKRRFADRPAAERPRRLAPGQPLEAG